MFFDVAIVSRAITLLEGSIGELPKVSKSVEKDGSVSIIIGTKTYTDSNSSDELVSRALHNLMGAVAVQAIREEKFTKEKHELEAIRDRTTRRFFNDDRTYFEIPMVERTMIDAIIAAEKGNKS